MTGSVKIFGTMDTDIYHYIEDGTDSCGNKLNIDKTISDLNKNYKKKFLE